MREIYGSLPASGSIRAPGLLRRLYTAIRTCYTEKKRRSNYTLTNLGSDIVSVQKQSDGSIILTVVGEGVAKMDLTVNGKDYGFYWVAIKG